MKFLNTKAKKITFWFLTSVIILAILIIAFISPIAKYLIEKYDVKYSGREVTLDWIYINPFTGYAHINDLKVYEYKSDSVFFKADGISVNFEMHKLLSKTYEISSFTLDGPVASIIQNKKEFNFNDLIEKFASKDTLPKAPKEPVHFNILDVSITDGLFRYQEKSIPVNYYIKHVNIESDGKKWDSDTIATKFSFQSGIGTGDVNGSMTMYLDSLDYRLSAVIKKFDLSALEQYLQDISNGGRIRAHLDADIHATGNFKKSEELNANGNVMINDFHIGKTSSDDYASFDRFAVSIKQLSPARKKYTFDSISLVHPYFKYERYDHLDNLQLLFGKEGEKVKDKSSSQKQVNILFQIADYVKLLAKNFFKSNYNIKRLAIYNADLRYNDYAINEKFAVSASPLTILADSIDRTSNKWVDLKLTTDLQPYGTLNFGVSINPQDSSDFKLHYHVQKVPLATFNPYLITYTSFPLDRGAIEVVGDWTVTKGVINAKNHLLVIDPRINKKQKRNGARWIPLKLIMFFVRERGNVIDYEIPITGNLSDPKFHFRDIIFDALENIFVKPITTPYRVEVKQVETDIEKSITLRWDMRSDMLKDNQVDFLEKIADNLKENPAINITVRPILYTEKEKEYIAFFEAKKRYYLHLNKKELNTLTESDTSDIDKISVKDSLFNRYMDHKNAKTFNTVQERCVAMVGHDKINTIYNAMMAKRKKSFLYAFKELGVENRVKLVSSKEKIPYNGFSIYVISYKGGIPEKLEKDYQEIKDLDNESPRSKFKDFRLKYKKELRDRR